MKLIVLLFILISCNDDDTRRVVGETGPRGFQGNEGPRGEQGPQGPAGKDSLMGKPEELNLKSNDFCARIENSQVSSRFYLKMIHKRSVRSNMFQIYFDPECSYPISNVIYSPTGFFIKNTGLYLNLWGRGQDRKAYIYHFGISRGL